MKWLFGVFIILQSLTALAFPDLVRHNYVSCRACHVSAGGGGLLSPYGRNLSKELISTWAFTGEEAALYVPQDLYGGLKDKLVLGGDFRHLKRRKKIATSETNENFLMQGNLKVGFLTEKLEIVASFGSIENPRESEQIDWKMAEYYIQLLTDEKTILKFGSFQPQYGINLPDHNLWIKSRNNIFPFVQRDGVELSFTNDTDQIFVGGYQTRAIAPTPMQHTGYSAVASRVFGERQKIGVSYKAEEGPMMRLHSAGLWGILSPWNESNYILIEYDRVKTLSSNHHLGLIRSGYEVHKGVIPFLQLQVSRQSTPIKLNDQLAGIGMQWLPRPHFEFLFTFEYGKQNEQRLEQSLLTLHYYL